MIKKYVAEGVGTFALSFAIFMAAATGNAPLTIPVIAGLVLLFFVYTIGPISGSHINPAVTLGLLSVKKISLRQAVAYIVAQVIGAGLAIVASKLFGATLAINPGVFKSSIFFAEALGMFFFAFGIASVVYGNVKEQASGLVVGGSLLLGITIASVGGAFGILNPAVAFALGSLTLVYLFAPILGSVVGFQVYAYLAKEK